MLYDAVTYILKVDTAMPGSPTAAVLPFHGRLITEPQIIGRIG